MEKDQTWENTVAIMWEKIWPKSNLSLDSLQNENNSVKLLKIWILTNSRVHKSDFDEILGIRIAQMFIFAQFKSEYLILDNFQSAKIWLWRFLKECKYEFGQFKDSKPWLLWIQGIKLANIFKYLHFMGFL